METPNNLWNSPVLEGEIKGFMSGECLVVAEKNGGNSCMEDPKLWSSQITGN